MKSILLSLFLFALIFSSCSSDDDFQQETYNAIVLQNGINCTNSYVVHFKEGVQGLPENYFDNSFYEINLPDNFKEHNKEVYLTFRTPQLEETIVCPTLLQNYPQIYILSAQ